MAWIEFECWWRRCLIPRAQAYERLNVNKETQGRIAIGTLSEHEAAHLITVMHRLDPEIVGSLPSPVTLYYSVKDPTQPGRPGEAPSQRRIPFSTIREALEKARKMCCGVEPFFAPRITDDNGRQVWSEQDVLEWIAKP